jgi:hypothetical protein
MKETYRKHQNKYKINKKKLCEINKYKKKKKQTHPKRQTNNST